MKKLMLIFIFICNLSFSQNIKKCCKDNIQIETIKKQSYLNINNVKTLINIRLNNSKEYNIDYDIHCHTLGFNLKTTINFGNEYTIMNYIFEKENNKYLLKYTYRETSNRNSSMLEGRIDKSQSLKDLDITDKNVFGTFPFLIESTKDLQNEKTGGVTTNFFSSLIEKNKGNPKNLMIIANHYYTEKYDVLNTQKIDNLNDLAYYLQKQSKNKDAIYLLEKILKKDSTRIVAWLNLADAQWELKNNSEAKKSYQKYISLMKSQNKDLKKIPQRVHDRIK